MPVREAVWNLGSALFRPNAFSVVPGEAELTVQYRSPSMEILDRFEKRLNDLVVDADHSGPVSCECETDLRVDPVKLASRIRNMVAAAAADHGAPSLRFSSGAGHDAMVMAEHLPTGMLFIPSIGGRSHTREEDSTEEDIVLGAEVAMSCVEKLLGLA